MLSYIVSTSLLMLSYIVFASLLMLSYIVFASLLTLSYIVSTFDAKLYCFRRQCPFLPQAQQARQVQPWGAGRHEGPGGGGGQGGGGEGEGHQCGAAVRGGVPRGGHQEGGGEVRWQDPVQGGVVGGRAVRRAHGQERWQVRTGRKLATSSYDMCLFVIKLDKSMLKVRKRSFTYRPLTIFYLC